MCFGFVLGMVYIVNAAIEGLKYSADWEDILSEGCTKLVLVCRLFDCVSATKFNELQDHHPDLFSEWERHWNVDHAPMSWPHSMTVRFPRVSSEDPVRWTEDDSDNYTGAAGVHLERYVRDRNRVVTEYGRFREWLENSDMSGILNMFHDTLRAEYEAGEYPCEPVLRQSEAESVFE